MSGLLRNRRILIIDDAPDIRRIICEILKREGASIEVAKNGTSALQTAAQQQFDLALLDLHLPDMSGFEIAAQMRNHGFKSLIYAFTAADEDYLSREKMDSAGFSGWIPKDFISIPLSEFPRTISELF